LERIVFLRGKIDRRRETPSIVVNDLVPIEDAVGKLTTSVGLKLDPSRHSPAITAELDPLLRRHKGNTEVYVQITSNQVQRAVLRLDRERFVKPSLELKQELEHLLGIECTQFSGAGTRRRKRQAQQALFREDAAEEESAAPAMESIAVTPEMEMEESLVAE
jgi:DNA polymerase III subunit alpha